MNKSQGIFHNKKISMITAVLLAIVFWFTITLIENPESSRVISGIPIYLDTEGTVVDEQGLSAINFNSKNYTASVKISGSSYVVNSVTPDDLLITPTFEGVNAAGEYPVKIAATNNSTKNFTVESVTPESVNVQFDYWDTVSYDISIRVKYAKAADGLILGAERFTNSETAKLEVSGPRSTVSKISSVYAEAAADKTKKLKATESYDADIVLYDADNKKISTDGLTMSFKTISVSVPVYKVKTVPIKCAYTNKPADYTPVATVRIGSKQVTEVEIEGTPDILDKINFVELEPIDFYKITKDNNSFAKALVLPSGIATAEELPTPQVTLDTSNLKTKTFRVSRITAVNNSGGYSVKLNQPVSVTLCGSKNAINSLRNSNLYCEVDLEGKTVGEQSLSVKIKSSIRDNVWQLSTLEAKVTVSK